MSGLWSGNNMCELITNNIAEIIQWVAIGFALIMIGRLWEATKK